ncbi:tRNA splicing endonuclease subunit 2 [Brevipalpus obovatus]|uniref:tRNA splicing endonuclease subunit 2 n=1 Tax=Brevipalpus obovatus TaxID=246614 RepID=UPI003D9E9052
MNSLQVLIDRKSDRKLIKSSNFLIENRLPYPIPLRNDAGKIQYPLSSEKAVIYFNCYINYEKQCCEVHDESSMYALYQHGYFGKGSLSSNAPIFEVVSKLTPDQSKGVGHSETDLQKLFPYIPETQKIINDLYSPHLTATAGTKSNISQLSNLLVNESQLNVEPSLDRLIKSNGEDEKLCLGLEEVFFLSYALGCMNVTDPRLDRQLSLGEMWKTFCSLHDPEDRSHFASYYAAYHYFRAKGWVVKSGIKYGSDFVAYKEGPAFFHSLFSIVVYSLKFNEHIKSKYPSRDWLFLSSWVRVTESVGKNPVLCLIHIPEDCDFDDPQVIKSFEIEIIALKRFEAGRERQTTQSTDRSR